MRPLQLAHFKLYLENAIELEAHRHGVFNGSTSPSLQWPRGATERLCGPLFGSVLPKPMRPKLGDTTVVESVGVLAPDKNSGTPRAAVPATATSESAGEATRRRRAVPDNLGTLLFGTVEL